MMAQEFDHVFAYGSNMDLEHLAEWCHAHCKAEAEIFAAQVAILPEHKLIWNYYTKTRKGGAANIVASAGSQLPGLLLKVSKATLGYIDRKEAYPHHYDRALQSHIVLADRSQLHAWVYQVVPRHRQATSVWPTRAYLNILINAAKKHGLPEWHIAELAATQTRD